MDDDVTTITNSLSTTTETRAQLDDDTSATTITQIATTTKKTTFIRQRKSRILLGVTGSVAAVKSPEIAVRLVRDLDMDVRVLLTDAGNNFWCKANQYNPEYWLELKKYIRTKQIIIHQSEDEWKNWNQLGDPVMHIDLRNWADMCLIAPLSANTLAKISTGLCDNCLSSVIRAWDYGHGDARPGKLLVLAPAMNTAMWDHPLTQQQLCQVKSFWNINNATTKCGVHIVDPQVKTLACGEVGSGALAPVNEILDVFTRLGIRRAAETTSTTSIHK